MNGIKRIPFVQTIVITIIIAYIYSLKTNLLVASAAGAIIGIALLTTDYLYRFDKRILNFFLILIAGSALCSSYQLVYKNISLFQVMCFFLLTFVIYAMSRQRKKNKPD